jgi:hypothetical protein
MVYLKKGQVLSDNPAMVVYDPTGYYNDGDPVVCASVESPDEPVCRYEAKYINYGSIVYSISNPEELDAEIMKIDPKSLFGKDSKEVAQDKMVDEIKTVDTKVDEEVKQEDSEEETEIIEEESIPEPEVVPEPEVIPEPEVPVVSEPEVIPEPEVPVVPEPEVIPVPDIAVDPEVVPETTPTNEILGFLKKRKKRKLS